MIMVRMGETALFIQKKNDSATKREREQIERSESATFLS